MATTVRCPKCQTLLRLANTLAGGQKAKCPKCSVFFSPNIIEEEDEEKPRASTKSSKLSLDDKDDEPRQKSAAKRRNDEEDDPRPARKSKPSRDDEDEEDEPKRKSAAKRRDDDEEEEDDAPRSRKGRDRDDDDDDDKPKRKLSSKRQRDEDDEDDRPRKSKKKKKESGGKGLLIGLIAGAGVLLLAGGGLAVWAFTGSKPDRNTVAVAPPGGGSETSAQGGAGNQGNSTPSTPSPTPKPGNTPQGNNTPQGSNTPPANNTNTPTQPAPKPAPPKPNPPPKKDPVVEPEIPPVQEVEGLDADQLERVRKATVMVRVEIGKKTGTGTGFIVRSSGETAYLITNFHVIAMKPDEEKPAYRDPRFAMFRRPEPKKEEKNIFVVLRSGTPEEQTVSAELVGIDGDADLAALRISGLRNLPAAIDLERISPLAETMPIYIFGHPGGNKTMSISKGSVSQLRKDENDELNDVQINGQINPGNSGGPVVDSEGRLVGVAVSTVRGKNVGFAIPVGQVKHMLAGRIFYSAVMLIKPQGNKVEITSEFWLFDGNNKVRFRDQSQDTIQVDGRDIPPGTYFFRAQLSDPMHKIKTVGMQYCLAPESVPPPDAKGAWTTLDKPTKVPLKIEDQDTAFGTFKLPPGSVPDKTYALQVYYVNSEGQTIYTEPHLVRLTIPKNLKSLTLKITVPPDEAVRRFIQDTVGKTFKGISTRVVRTNYGMQVELDPVDDPKTATDKITFGEVTATEGRTVSIKVTKVELPLPDEKLAAKAIEDLKSTENGRRKAACDWLARVYRPLPEKQEEIAKLVEPLASDKDFWMKMAACNALIIWATTDNVPAMIKLLEDEKYEHRGIVVQVLAKLKDPRAAPALANLLPNFFVRAGVVTALKAIGPAAEKSVITLLSHKDFGTVMEACNVLKEIGTSESVTALKAFISTNPNPGLKNAANDAIKAIEARKK